MKRFFSEEEWNSLNSNKRGSFDFFELWTCKESYAKFLGLGLQKPFSSFSISKSDNMYTINDPKNAAIVYLTTFQYKNEYYVSVCSEEEISSTINHVSLEDMTQSFLQPVAK